LPQERRLLQAEKPATRDTGPVPWRRLLLRVPTWAMVTAHFATTWSLYVLLSWWAGKETPRPSALAAMPLALVGLVLALDVRLGGLSGRWAEIGAGVGYFTFRLARAVGPRGRVYAVDPEPRMLARLVGRLPRARARNVTPVLGRDEDPLLPAGACDLILVVNTYHHFPDGPAFLRRLVRALRPGGRIANVDFHRRETPVGPPVEHRVAREAFVRDARRAGLRLAAERDFLPYQYFLILAPR